MRAAFILAVLYMVTAGGALQAEELRYVYSHSGEPVGYETEDYFFNVRKGAMGYKLRTDDGRGAFVYSPEGELIIYREKKEERYVLDDPQIKERVFRYYYPNR